MVKENLINFFPKNLLKRCRTTFHMSEKPKVQEIQIIYHATHTMRHSRPLIIVFFCVCRTKAKKISTHRTSRKHKLCSHQACSIFTHMSNCVGCRNFPWIFFPWKKISGRKLNENKFHEKSWFHEKENSMRRIFHERKIPDRKFQEKKFPWKKIPY